MEYWQWHQLTNFWACCEKSCIDWPSFESNDYFGNRLVSRSYLVMLNWSLDLESARTNDSRSFDLDAAISSAPMHAAPPPLACFVSHLRHLSLIHSWCRALNCYSGTSRPSDPHPCFGSFRAFCVFPLHSTSSKASRRLHFIAPDL